MKNKFHLYHFFSNSFSILMYLLMSSVNSIAARWGLSFITIGLINLAGGISYISASLFFGRLGDRFGHKKILIIATFFFSFFNILGFFWSNTVELFIFNIGLNVFFGIFYPQIEGLLSKEEKLLGIDPANTINRFTISWSSGNVLGMAMGPFLIVRFPYIIFCYGITLSLASYFILKRDLSKNGESIAFFPSQKLKKPSNKIDFPRIKLYRKVYRTTLVMSGLVYVAVLSLFPKAISMNGLPIALSGFIVVGANIGVFLTFILLGRFKIWVGNPKIAGLFILAFPLMTLFIFFPPSIATFFVISLLAGVSYAVPYTYAIFYGLNSPDKDQGKQGGFHEAIMGTMWAIGPLLGALSIQLFNSIIGLGIAATFLSVVILLIQIRFVKITRSV